MPAWQDYTEQIDQVLGSLDPNVRAVVEAYTTHDAHKNPDLSNRNYNIALAELKNAGYSQQDATTLLQVAYNVRRMGGWDTNTPMTGGDAFRVDPAELERFFASGAKPSGGGGDDIMGKLDAFYKQLMGGIPDNDPTAQYIQRHAANAAQAYGGRAGLNARSTLGAGAAAAQYNNGMQAYDFQRKQLATTVAGLMNNRDLGLGQLNLAYTDQQNKLAEQQAAFQQNQMQGLGSIIGGVAGTAIGAYTGGAQGAAFGGQSGSQFGAGAFGLLGGVGGGAPQYRQPGGLGGRNPYTGW